MKKTVTGRGFDIYKFNDSNGDNCTLQKSSSACEDFIWLGTDNVPLKILASKAKENNVTTDETTGWVEFPIPSDVLVTDRMHLSRKDVGRLLPILIKFWIFGEI